MSRENEVTEFLAHYGVKGQRWGVRNKRDSSDGSSTKKKRTLGQKLDFATGVLGLTAIVLSGANFANKLLDAQGQSPARVLKRQQKFEADRRASKAAADKFVNPHGIHDKYMSP